MYQSRDETKEEIMSEKRQNRRQNSMRNTDETAYQTGGERRGDRKNLNTVLLVSHDQTGHTPCFTSQVPTKTRRTHRSQITVHTITDNIICMTNKNPPHASTPYTSAATNRITLLHIPYFMRIMYIPHPETFPKSTQPS